LTQTGGRAALALPFQPEILDEAEMVERGLEHFARLGTAPREDGAELDVVSGEGITGNATAHEGE
jgi:hypothetical protein